MNRTRRGMYAFMQKHLQARPASRVDASEDFGLVNHMIEMHAPGAAMPCGGDTRRRTLSS